MMSLLYTPAATWEFLARPQGPLDRAVAAGRDNMLHVMLLRLDGGNNEALRNAQLAWIPRGLALCSAFRQGGWLEIYEDLQTLLVDVGQHEVAELTCLAHVMKVMGTDEVPWSSARPDKGLDTPEGVPPLLNMAALLAISCEYRPVEAPMMLKAFNWGFQDLLEHDEVLAALVAAVRWGCTVVVQALLPSAKEATPAVAAQVAARLNTRVHLQIREGHILGGTLREGDDDDEEEEEAGAGSVDGATATPVVDAFELLDVAFTGVTALHVAAMWGRADVAALLLKHGADVNARAGVSGWTPVHAAAAYRWEHCLYGLLQSCPRDSSGQLEPPATDLLGWDALSYLMKPEAYAFVGLAHPGLRELCELAVEHEAALLMPLSTEPEVIASSVAVKAQDYVNFSVTWDAGASIPGSDYAVPEGQFGFDLVRHQQDSICALNGAVRATLDVLVSLHPAMATTVLRSGQLEHSGKRAVATALDRNTPNHAASCDSQTPGCRYLHLAMLAGDSMIVDMLTCRAGVRACILDAVMANNSTALHLGASDTVLPNFDTATMIRTAEVQLLENVRTFDDAMKSRQRDDTTSTRAWLNAYGSNPPRLKGGAIAPIPHALNTVTVQHVGLPQSQTYTMEALEAKDAIVKQRARAVQLLLERGADIEIKNTPNNNRPDQVRVEL